MQETLLQRILNSLEYSMMTTFPMTVADFFGFMLSVTTYVLGIFYVALAMHVSERGRKILDKLDKYF